jgi:hypothetical protein
MPCIVFIRERKQESIAAGRIDPDRGTPSLEGSVSKKLGGASAQSNEIRDRDCEENHNGTQNEIALSSGHSAPLEWFGMAIFQCSVISR